MIEESNDPPALIPNTMPHQNRVNPFNNLIATPARGTLVGNRGILHDDQGRIVRPFSHKNWVACVLDFGQQQKRKKCPIKT